MRRSRAGVRTFRSSLPFLSALVVFSLLGAWYRRLIPPFEGPDEAEHFAYITWLVEGKGFPPHGAAAWETPVHQEAGQPPLYYLLAAIPALFVDISNPPALFRPNPHFPSTAPGMIPDNKNRAIHPGPAGTDSQPLRGGWLALSLARGVSFLFGLLLVSSVYGLGREMWPAEPWMAAAAAMLVAVTPQILFLSNVVSNDIAAAATGALTLWLLARLLRRGPSRLQAMGLGAALGLAALSKVSLFALAVPVIVALAGQVYQALPTEYSGSNARQAISPQRFVACLLPVLYPVLWMAVAALVVGGWWYGRSWLLDGSPFGLSAHDYAPWAITPSAQSVPRLAEWMEVFLSYWAALGWGNIKFPGWVYSGLMLLCLVAIVGLARLAVHWWHTSAKFEVTAILLIGLVSAVLSVATALAFWMQRVTAPHGRLLFPAAAAIAVLLIVGWQAIHRWVVIAGIAVIAILALLVPPLLLRPAYASPQPLPASELKQLVVMPLDWRFGNIAELRGILPLKQSVLAGESFPIRICWYSLARSLKDYSILVQLVGPNNTVVASRRTYPGLGNFPTSSWQPGILFCDVVRVDIPASLPRTLLYKIEVGLIDGENGERLPVYDNLGNPRSETFAGTVRLVTTTSPRMEEMVLSNDNPIQLVDYSLETSWHVGQRYDITFRWRLAKVAEQDYTVFIHLRDQATGEIIAQADGPPVNGWYPTSTWALGETVEDTHVFNLPPSVGPGCYDLVVGWYEPTTGLRLTGEQLLDVIEVAP